MKFINFLEEKGYSKNTIKAYVYHAKKFAGYIKNVDELLIAKRLIYSSVQKYKPGTIRVLISTLELLCEFSEISFDDSWKKNLRLKDNSIFMDTLTSNEIKKILSCCPEKSDFVRKRNTLLLSFLYYSGARVSEVINLRKSDFKNGYISIIGKGDKFRNILVPKEIFDECLLVDSDYIFSKKSGDQLTTKAINKIIKFRIQQCKINKNITAHSFRRTYCTNLVREGANIKIVSILMGHSRIETTAKYMHFNKEDIMQEYTKFMK